MKLRFLEIEKKIFRNYHGLLDYCSENRWDLFGFVTRLSINGAVNNAYYDKVK